VLADIPHRAEGLAERSLTHMFRVLDWNFSGTAEPVVASLLLATLVLSIVLL
jgi:hypothetical protein